MASVSVSYEMLKELECPVCMQFLTSPIVLCNNGHSICIKCRRNVQQCPICRSGFSDVRCRTFEIIMKELKFQCKNQAQGCTEVIECEDIKDHVQVCKAVPHDCPLNKFEEGYCSWMGYFSDLMRHVEEKHRDVRIWRQPNFTSKTLSTLKTVVHLSEDTFLYYKVLVGGKWSFVVMLLGTRTQASAFKSVFTLTGNDGMTSLIETRPVRSFAEDLNDIFDNYLCLRLDEKQAKNFVEDEELKLSIKICKINDADNWYVACR